MASVRKRTWTSKGVRNQAWVADYSDAGGIRRSRQFKLKKEAEEFLTTVATELRDGVHVAAGASPTVAAFTRREIEGVPNIGKGSWSRSRRGCGRGAFAVVAEPRR